MDVVNPQTASTTIRLSPGATSGYIHAQGLTKESADRTSELLTLNHALHHPRWKASFHNHLVHHLLALWSLGASPDEIQDMWDYNLPYQAPREAQDAAAAAASEDLDLENPALFDACLSQGERYADFLRFFEAKVAAEGVPSVVREYVLAGDARANDIHSRMYTDLVHPMIHLGCALEFQQPSLVAEALAWACVHDNWPRQFLLPAEAYAHGNNSTAPSRSLLHILTDLRADPVIATGVRDTDPFDKIPDGFLRRVTPAHLAPHLAQFRVAATPDDLQRQLTEMMYTCAYMLGAAQRPGKRVAMDFVLLHTATLSVHYPALLALDWLSDAEKARLLEAKARVDAVMYAGCRCPPLYPARITAYRPRRPQDGWPELFHRSIVYRDEGHAAKLVRALYGVEQVGEAPAGFPIQRGDVVTIAHMAMDSIERALEEGGSRMPDAVARDTAQRIGFGGEMVVNNQMRWVFYGGLDKAWDFVPELEGAA